MMARYAIFLRGINVGKAKRVAMADLRALLAAEGYANVATLLQSGNIVLDADLGATDLVPAIEQAFTRRFGFGSSVVIRNRAEILDVVAHDPLGEVATDGSRYLVAFLSGPPDAAMLAALESAELGADRYAVNGTELYLWCPNSVLESPLMTALGKLRGGPTSTMRNWNTMQKLVPLLG
jgi:uncharacterized protein (DUF1697 family)